MARGITCDPVSPGSRRGLFVCGRARPKTAWTRGHPKPRGRAGTQNGAAAQNPRSPGWKPGDSAREHHPVNHAPNAHPTAPQRTHAWHAGSHATRCPPAPAGGFLCAAEHAPKRRGRAGTQNRAAARAPKTVRQRKTQEAPGGNPGTPRMNTTPSTMLQTPTRPLRNAWLPPGDQRPQPWQPPAHLPLHEPASPNSFL